MARATQVTSATKKVSISIKPKAPAGTMRCNMCGGTGYQKKPTSRKKKK